MPSVPQSLATRDAPLLALLVCLTAVAAHVLVVFLLAVIARSDDHLAELAVSAGPWILAFLLPELFLLGGAVACGFSPPGRRAHVAVRFGKLALVSVGLVAAWMLSSRDRMEQAIWLIEGFGG
jgi:hypothetical protein